MKFRYSLSCVDGKTNVLIVTQVFLISCRALSILSTSLLLLNLNTFARSCTHSLLTSLSFSTLLALVVTSFSLWSLTISINTNYLFYFFLVFFSLILCCVPLSVGGFWLDQWRGPAAPGPVWGNSHLRKCRILNCHYRQLFT